MTAPVPAAPDRDEGMELDLDRISATYSRAGNYDRFRVNRWMADIAALLNECHRLRALLAAKEPPMPDTPIPSAATEATDLAALAVLLDAGTPGPWETTCMGSEGYHVHEQEASVGIRRKRTALCTYEAWEDDRANATLIAALRNAAPGLIAEVAELRDLSDRRGAALAALWSMRSHLPHEAIVMVRAALETA